MSKSPRKPRKAVDANETPAAKFSRLASQRVTKAVKAIGNIGNLAGRSYVRTEEQGKAICKYLNDAVAQVEDRFSAPVGSVASTDTIKI